jgi:predicted phosphodiesterase
MIEEAVKDLINEKPLVVNKVAMELEGNEAVLNFSDFHLGIAINNYFNEYNEEIAIKRIEMLTEKVIQYCDMHNITKLHLALNGDLINGYKYLSLIADKDMSVVQSTVRASEIISDMISKFCKHLNKVDLYFAIGNHASMKQTKDCLDEDNFEYFILDFIKLRTKDLKNLEIHRNKYSDDIININIGDKLIIVTHGDKDKPKTVINKLCTFLDERPHFVMLGHYHHYEEFDQNNINIKVNGSIVSTDGYAFKLRLNSRACQTLVVHDKNGDEIIDENSNIGTGMTLKILLAERTVNFTIIVTGDVDGNGIVDIADLIYINRHRLEKITLEGIYLEAGDINKDNSVNIIDLLQLNKFRLGKIVF